MNMEWIPAALSAGMTDMLRVLLTAAGVTAAGCLIWGLLSFLRRKRKGRGPASPKDEDPWKGGPGPR